MSSSSIGACPHHSERRWPSISASSARRSTYSTSGVSEAWIEAVAMFVRQPVAATNEDFPQRCVRRSHHDLHQLSRLAAALRLLRFVGICLRRLAHPRAVVVGFSPRRHSIAVARAIAGKHLLEFVPI